MEYRVVITSDAETDLDDFLRYLLFAKNTPSLTETSVGENHLHHPKIIPHIRRLGRDITVLTVTHPLAKATLFLYFSERITVVPPAGIAARITEIRVTSSDTPNRLHATKTTVEIVINRMNV